MIKPSRYSFLLIVLLLIAPVLNQEIVRASVRHQAPTTPTAVGGETATGIRLYNQGDIQGAIKQLRDVTNNNKSNGEAWHYLGLSFIRKGDITGARKALETAVKLRPGFAASRAALAFVSFLANKMPDALREARKALEIEPRNVEAYYVISSVHLRQGDPGQSLAEIETALKYQPDFAAAYLLKNQAALSLYAQKTSYAASQPAEVRKLNTAANRELLKQAAASLERYFELDPAAVDSMPLRKQLENLRDYVRVVSDDSVTADARIYEVGEVTTRARILSKPEPPYTEAARNARINGVVTLRVVFASDGTIQNILVLKSLPNGLTENVLRVARQISFVPATKDGRIVSMYAQLEYHFTIQ